MKRRVSFLLLCAAVWVALSGFADPEASRANPSGASPASSQAAPAEASTAPAGPASQPPYAYETQELYAMREGNRIYGVVYIPQDAGEKMPAVIFSHGFGGTHSVGAQYAENLAENGYVVYCFDFCGDSPNSRSDGSALEMSLFTEQANLEAVISMVQELDYACKKTGACVQQDDAAGILQQMVQADVIALVTPVYFYSMAGQVKTLIDRCLACGSRLEGKKFYFIATAADAKEQMERTIDGLRGFTDCLPGAKVKGVIYGAGAWQLEDIQGNPAMDEAYQMGRSV